MRTIKPALLASFLFASGFLLGQSEKKDIEIAPGIVLPSTGVVYGLDVRNDKPVLLQIHATEVSNNSHAGGNLARSMVYAGPHSSIELRGINSAGTFHTQRAVLYVRLNSDDPELLRNRVKLLRLQVDKDRRIVTDFSMNIFGGQRKQRYDEIAVEKSDIAGTQWVKLTPQKTLEPGEYAVVFAPKDPNFFADAVYDFTIGGDSTRHAEKQ
jgi:hypothetical protein